MNNSSNCKSVQDFVKTSYCYVYSSKLIGSLQLYSNIKFYMQKKSAFLMTWVFSLQNFCCYIFNCHNQSERSLSRITRQNGKFKPTSIESKMSFIRFSSIQLHFVISTTQINTFVVYFNQTGKRHRKWKSQI